MTFSRRRVARSRTVTTEEQMIRDFIAGEVTLAELDERDEWFSFVLATPNLPLHQLAARIWEEVGAYALKPYKNGVALPDYLQFMVDTFGRPESPPPPRRKSR